jgi:hypothetical protein
VVPSIFQSADAFMVWSLFEPVGIGDREHAVVVRVHSGENGLSCHGSLACNGRNKKTPPHRARRNGGAGTEKRPSKI